ncbi:MAG: SRPBCC domain-containing protein [Fimbriimonadaceae bacterium]|nr:SRPBCC domain-containing protein [Alphaproteobacteria bacterium]
MNILTPSRFGLKVKRRFKASAETLFQAWTDPLELQKWFGPAGFSIPHAEIDLRVGGRYRIAMQPVEGDLFYHEGVYTEITPPRRLSFTWILKDQPCEGSQNEDCETLVTVEFVPAGDMTELVVTHEMLPSEAARDGHEFGWNSSLDCLEETLR